MKRLTLIVLLAAVTGCASSPNYYGGGYPAYSGYRPTSDVIMGPRRAPAEPYRPFSLEQRISALESQQYWGQTSP